MGLFEDLKFKILIGDGVIGIFFYLYGIDSCFEELNIIKSEEVFCIYRVYVEVGVNVI